MKKSIGQFDVIGFGVLWVVIEGGEYPIGNSVRVVPEKRVVAVGMFGVGQGKVLVASVIGFFGVVSNVLSHIGLNVQDKTPQPLFDSLLNEWLDNVMGLAGPCSPDDLNILMEGFGWYDRFALFVQG